MPQYSGRLESRFGEVYPAPYVTVRVNWGGQFSELPGLIDSGADLSMIPKYVVDALGIQKVSEIPIEGVNGGLADHDTFVVSLEFHGFSVRNIEVAETDTWPCVLIGRDVLNDLVTDLDGPALTFRLVGDS